MKKVNLKSPKYVLPLIALPFILIFFYLYRQLSSQPSTQQEPSSALNSDLAKVSEQISDKGLQSKLEAYRDHYRESDGYTAISSVEEELSKAQPGSSGYTQNEKRMLDSMQNALKAAKKQTPDRSPGTDERGSAQPAVREWLKNHSQNTHEIQQQDQALASALNAIKSQQSVKQPLQERKKEDPMQLFRAQMSLIDSMSKANDPRYHRQTGPAQPPLNELVDPSLQPLKVSASKSEREVDQALLVGTKPTDFLPAMIDEGISLQSGSRIRIRLLGDIFISGEKLSAGSIIYGMVSGFNSQRLLISINSIFFQGRILPVKLEAFDLDGIKGLYVPQSAFREFTRDLAGSTTQGISLNPSSAQKDQLMGTLGRMFSSGTSAINRLLKVNKAKINYATQLLLVDVQQLQKQP